jgi:hypothetical protein
MVIRVEAARVDFAILLDYLTAEMALEERDIGCTEPNNPLDDNSLDDELHFGMPLDRGDY